jgi:hypothetical protein
MYIVRDKATGQNVHVNPAPVSQKLEGVDLYYRLDLTTMAVGRGELNEVPTHFDISEQGLIVPWTLERQVKEGVRALPPDQKAVGNDVVEKPLAQKVAEGLVKLKPTEKLVDDRIEPKTIAEQVAEGLIKLTPTQVVDGDVVREMTHGEKAAAGLVELDPRLKVVGKEIAFKTPAELVRDKLVKLADDEKVEGDEIVKLTPREMLAEGRYDLKRYKQAVLERFTEASLAARRKELPDHQLLYAAVGALDAATTEKYRKIATDHAKLLDKAAKDIEKASSADEVDNVAGLGDWPKEATPQRSGA